MPNKKQLVSIGSLAVIGVTILLIWFLTKTPITITVDEKTVFLRTHAKTVAELLKKQGIPYSSRDKVSPSLTSSLTKGLHIEVRHAIPVTLLVGGKTKELFTTGKTVKEALTETKQVLSLWDKVEPPLSAALTSNIKIKITKAIPVTVIIGTSSKHLMTIQPTVSQLLQELKIDVGNNDKLVPPSSTAIIRPMTITLTRIRREHKTEKVALSYSSYMQFTTNLFRGERRVKKHGKNGLAEQAIEVVFANNKLFSKKVLSRKVLIKPQSEVILAGVKPHRFLAARGGSSFMEDASILEMEASAYDPGPLSCGPYANGYTSIGLKAGYGIVAVDPSVIPLRTRLFIEGYGYAIAGDVGSAIKGYRIDLGFETRREALQFGRKRVKVYILKNN